MKNRRGICLLPILTVSGCVLLIGTFICRNPGAPFPSGEIFSPAADIVHTEATAAPVCSDLININTATAEELQTLPGIGPSLSQRISAYRAENGPFRSVAELTKIKGIGEKCLEKLLDYITTGG